VLSGAGMADRLARGRNLAMVEDVKCTILET
jgi:hypothetical protein